MERYKNLSGTSGVAAFEAGENFIRVRFTDGGQYLYTHAKPGRTEVERMKALAARGLGLNTFINQGVKTRYTRKER